MIKKLTGKLYLDNFLLGILAGLAIAMGGTFFLTLVSFGQKFFGAVSFCAECSPSGRIDTKGEQSWLSN